MDCNSSRREDECVQTGLFELLMRGEIQRANAALNIRPVLFQLLR